ncbi:AAA family ATPase [Candidatus Uhrbacteria bacterium]|nr:AAA family ATPase [Candidatus Uhrbacteria bacterium]MBD3283858.1 AAA family ATPase [Candidatus Uhrbacteria bacterium]
MYLRRLELQGFKTFATKTVLEFAPEDSKRRGITGVVGPNGSGKSNIADAIRWVMGEQSMKLLRGKKSEDMIFSGSEKKSRSGFAEVTMTLVNDAKHSEIDMPEIVVTRRLYRDGKSEFEINRRAAKLGDVTLLLAQAGIGQRTYSVIGQGMVDAVLSAGPAERKEFFDEAAGLRPYQLKRHQSITKLQTSRERLAQAEALLREIAPRLSSLQRQVKRLEQRDELEKEKQELEERYFGGMWHEIWAHLTNAQTKVDQARTQEKELLDQAAKLETEFAAMEQAVPPSKAFEGLRQQLDTIAEERAALREEQAKLQARVEMEKAQATQPKSPLSLGSIIQTVEGTQQQLDELWMAVNKEDANLERIKALIHKIHTAHQEFTKKLQEPAPEAKSKEVDPKLLQGLESITSKLKAIGERSKVVQQEIDDWDKKEAGKRTHLFETQRKLNETRETARQAEHRASQAAVEMARWETKRDSFLSELKTYAPQLEAELNHLAQRAGDVQGVAELQPRLHRVRSQLEWIGNIDPATQKEYEETKERFEFLNNQVEDLRGAIQGLDTVIKELDETIRVRSEESFHTLNSAFSKTFKTLFGGGEAKLIQVPPEPTVDEEGNLVPPPADAPPAGIDIQATPPGKRLKAIALLSGGERALTSIALISAIMATNPSPFIVLDEVDAALDELNSRKFAEIIHDHAVNTQFIIVTHNRATMHQCSVLYGVTMGEEGGSKILSVKLEELEKLRSAATS